MSKQVGTSFELLALSPRYAARFLGISKRSLRAYRASLPVRR
jgi:hypothetical protein